MKRVRKFVLFGVTAALLVSGLAAVSLSEKPASATGSNPFISGALAPSARFRFEGQVSERVGAGPYTYLRVTPQAGGEGAWVVTMGRGLAEHESASVLVLGRADRFKSARLRRTFDSLFFGVVRRADVKAEMTQ